MAAANPYAVKNAAKRKAQEARDRAREPVITYYVVPRDLIQRSRTWLDLVSAADLHGHQIHRVQKRDAMNLLVPEGFAAVYEGAPGEVYLARQNW